LEQTISLDATVTEETNRRTEKHLIGGNMLLDSENMPSGLATSRTNYALSSVEKEAGLMSAGKNANNASVPCVSLRSRFAAEFKTNSATKNAKSPVRSPLGEIKLNNQDTTPRRTPKRSLASPMRSVGTTPSKAKEETLQKSLEWVKECAMWTNPARSCLVFSTGFLSLLTWHYTESGVIDYRPFSSLSYCGLFMLAYNFFGAILLQDFSPRPVVPQAQARNIMRQAQGILLASIPAVNRAFSGRDTSLTLKLALSMWAMITLNKVMNLSVILLLGHCAAFTLPLLLKNFETDIDRNVSLAKKLGLNAWNSVELDRKYKLALVGGGLGTLWLLCAIHTKITSLFLAVVVFKCFLSQAEVEKITNVAAPMTEKIHKKAKRISMGTREILTMGLGQLVSPINKRK
jgi:hypothetical protein